MTKLTDEQKEYANVLLSILHSFEYEILYSDTFIDFNAEHKAEDRLIVLKCIEDSIHEKVSGRWREVFRLP